MDQEDQMYVTALKTNKQEAKVELQIWNAETTTLKERLVLAEAADVTQDPPMELLLCIAD